MITKIIKYLRYKFSVFQHKRNFVRKLKVIKNPIFIDGHPDSKNFGDALNITIVEFMSGMSVFPSKFISNSKFKDETSYSVIGSICQWSRSNSQIWGSGFIDKKYLKENFVHPEKIHAVRGPLTRQIYVENGVDCPEVYGDPALLLPLIYNPSQIEKKYKFGILAHYIDVDSEWIQQQKKRNDTLFIDIMIFDDYKKFVDELNSCEVIVTSSLHGLILSHAYQIPVKRVKFSDNLTGGDFKFNDYLLSVGKEMESPIHIADAFFNIESLEFDNKPINFDPKPLILHCPFLNSTKKDELLLKSIYYENT